MNEFQKIAIFASCVTFCLAGSVESREATKKATQLFKIGFIDELTLKDGNTPSWGQSTLKGFKLALRENSDLSVELIERNVSRSPTDALVAAKELVSQGADVIVGMRESGQALMVKKVTESTVPFVTFFATSDELLSKNGWTFQISLRDSIQVSELVKFLNKRLPQHSKVGIVVTQNDTYCTDMSKRLTEELKKLGHETVVLANILHGRPIPKDPFMGREKEFSHIGFFTDEVEALSLLKTLEEKKFSGTVFGGDSWPLPFLGPAFRTSSFPKMCLINSLSFESEQNSQRKRFEDQFKEAYSEDGNILAGAAYDAGSLVVKALRACKMPDQKSRRECINKNLKGVPLKGVTGEFSLDIDGGRSFGKSLLKQYGKCK
jgi:ABC-type branched-subunit amino acid transport system substrate-binding protein